MKAGGLDPVRMEYLHGTLLIQRRSSGQRIQMYADRSEEDDSKSAKGSILQRGADLMITLLLYIISWHFVCLLRNLTAILCRIAISIDLSSYFLKRINIGGKIHLELHRRRITRTGDAGTLPGPGIGYAKPGSVHLRNGSRNNSSAGISSKNTPRDTG